MTQSGFPAWSQTASSNSNADSTVNWAEGQAPSSVNDSARAMMAALAKYRDDVSGSLTTGGTATAYTLATNQVFASLADMDGMTLTIVPNVTNGASPTLAVDGLTAKGIKSATGVAVPIGALVAGTPYRVTYFNTAGEFILHDVSPVLGATTVTSLTASGDVSATGNVTGAAITATGAVSGASVAATGAVTGATATTTGLVTAGNGLTVSAGTVTLPAGSVANASLVSPPEFTKEYVSSPTVFTNTNTYTFTHGLGVVPKCAQAVLRCVTAELGYAVDDEIDVSSCYAVLASNAPGFSLMRNATSVAVVVAASTTIDVLRKDTSAGAQITFTNWKLVVRAWA